MPRALNRLGCSILAPLGLSLFLYLGLFSIRTRQAFLAYGQFALTDRISAALNPLVPSLTSDQLRWASYALFLLLALCYLWAIQLARITLRTEPFAQRQFTRWVILPYCLFGLLSLTLYPHLSRPLDIVDFAVHAREQLVYHNNPYVITGLQNAATEPLVALMEAQTRTSIYGPIWQYISLLPGAIGAGLPLPSIVAFKVLFFLAGLVCLWLLWLYHTRPDAHASQPLLLSGVIVAWNPLLHLISHGEGHNDIVMAVFVAAAMTALALKRPTAAVVGWGLSALVKFISAPLLAPLAVAIYRSQPARKPFARMPFTSAAPILLGLGLVVLIAVVSAAPFGPAAILAAVLGRYGELVGPGVQIQAPLPANLALRLFSLAGGSLAPATLAALVGLGLPLAWLVFTALRSLAVRDLETCARVSLESLLSYVALVSIPVYAQYLVVPAILAGFVSTGRWHRLTVIAASLAFAWDSLYVVYSPTAFPAWELALHRAAHLMIVALGSAYLLTQVARLVRRRTGLSRLPIRQ